MVKLLWRVHVIIILLSETVFTLEAEIQIFIEI